MLSWVAGLLVLIGVPALKAEVPATQSAPEESVLESQPVGKDGVAISVAVPRMPVPAGRQPVFIVRFKNTGQVARNLYDVSAYWNWEIRFTRNDPKTAPKSTEPGPWRLRVHALPNRALIDHRRIEPGEGTEIRVDLNDPPFTFDLEYAGIVKHPIAPLRFLPPGQYNLTATVKLPSFPIAGAQGFWLGPVITDPVAVTISPSTPKHETKETLARYDAAIAGVTDNLDGHGLWTNGVSVNLDLPNNASAENVVDMAINRNAVGSKDYQLLRVRPFVRDDVAHTQQTPGCAALLRVGKDYKVLIAFPYGRNSWWNRFYDAKLPD